LNGSYIPIGGAFLLALKRDGSRSLPFSSETQVFSNQSKLGIVPLQSDMLHLVGWDNGNSLLTLNHQNKERILIAPSYRIGLEDINRLKILLSLWNKKIRLSSAIQLIPMWSAQRNNIFDGVPGKNFIDQQEKWMRTDKKIDVFLDVESQELGIPIRTLEERNALKIFLDDMKHKDIGLYKVAAQVDSMPIVLDTEKHFAFLPQEISIVKRVI
jgi:hypothetical protein